MQPIPKPDLLDPDRILVNDRNDFFCSHETRAHALEAALRDSCVYAQQLWDDLDAARAYLLHSLPPDPAARETQLPTGTSPTGPDDQTGWDNWMNAYAAVTSTLCGPHGDSGFGVAEAHREANLRRAATIPTVADATQAIQQRSPSQARRETSPKGSDAAAHTAPPAAQSRAMRTLMMAVLLVLALRNRRHRAHTPA